MKTTNPARALIKRWPELFPASDTAIWRKWLKLEERSIHDIKDLVVGNFRDSIKARALLVAMVPDYRLSPVPWTTKRRGMIEPVEVNFLSTDPLAGLNETLLSFLLDAICTFREYATGARLRLLGKEHKSLILGNYNQYLCFLFRNVRGINLKQQAFDQIDFSRGYAFRNLILDSGFSLPWKKKACAKMQELVTTELKNLKKQKHGHGKAWYTYLGVIETLIAKAMAPTSFIAQQLAFAVTLPLPQTDSCPLGFADFRQMSACLHAEKYRHLRHQFARFATLREGVSLRIRGDSCLKSIRDILDEFGEKDLELREVLAPLVDEAKKTTAKLLKQQRLLGSKAKVLLQAMK